MKTILISPYSDIFGLGVRSLSAYLKRFGHEVKTIFLPSGQLEHRLATDWSYEYDEKVLKQVVEICEGSALIGITLMTNYFPRVARLTERLKSELSAPVLWGGIHATIRPEECLRYADLACVGEGENALLRLVECLKNGRDYQHIGNLWVKSNGRIIKNDVGPLIKDLDTLPYPDYDLEDHFILDRDAVKPMDEDLLKKYLQRSPHTKERYIPYTTMSSRGCPHHCSYCCNDVYLRLYCGEKYLRRKSPDKIIEEISLFRERFSFVNYVDFQDDSFFAASEQEIQRFCRLYKETIGLRFWCYGSPRTITEQKVKHLVEAGLDHVTMGIQTGSRRTQELYRRNITNGAVTKAARILNKYASAIGPPSYDIILDNPYESLEDNLETLRLLVDLPRPYCLRSFSLVFFPGTTLYERARQDGLITDEEKQIYKKHYHHYQGTYVNFMFYLISNRLPRPLLRLLIARPVVWLLDRRCLMTMFGRGYGFLKWIKRSDKKSNKKWEVVSKEPAVADQT
jgi:radical SAM superfamily enzyme YgiQ (UPF0313 family)